MSVLDSRVIFLTNYELSQMSNGTQGIVYKLKDIPGQPEYQWNGNNFVTQISHSYANTFVYLTGLHIQDAKFGDTANNTQFLDNGAMVASGSASLWKDIDFPIIIRTTGPNIPVIATLQGNIGVPQWAVNDYTVCEGQEIPHTWEEGTDLYWHCHIITNGLDATDRYVKWEIEWVWADINGTLSNTITTTSPDILIPANTPTKTHISCQLGHVNIAAHIGSHIYARLKRVASSGTAPTNNPWCSMLQIHAKMNTMGSQSMNLK